jgi:hypothetical protein
MYFDAAEAKITEIETRITTLEGAPAVDLSAVLAEIAEIKAELVRLDGRLDAIASAAAD